MSQEWSALPDAPGSGYQLLPTSSGAVLNGHYIDSPGWVLDAGSWTWSELPGGLHEDRDLSGVLMRDRAVYDTANSVGQVAARGAFVYDAEEHSYVSIPPFAARRNVSDDSTAALGRDLFVFGGQRWTGDAMDGTGELRNDAWLWTAPE